MDNTQIKEIKKIKQEISFMRFTIIIFALVAPTSIYAFGKLHDSPSPAKNSSTEAPTIAPTIAPTMVPTIVPTIAPTIEPTMVPTIAPTIAPTMAPTEFCNVGNCLACTREQDCWTAPNTGQPYWYCGWQSGSCAPTLTQPPINPMEHAPRCHVGECGNCKDENSCRAAPNTGQPYWMCAWSEDRGCFPSLSRRFLRGSTAHGA
jgi:hypothetical protein